MNKVSKIINTSNQQLGLECGLYLGPYDSEYNNLEDVNLPDPERERLARWCVIVEEDEKPTEAELRLAIAELQRAEEERQHRAAVEADCYWHNQVIHAEIHDHTGEDRARPRLVITCYPDYRGSSKQFNVDIIASIKHDHKGSGANSVNKATRAEVVSKLHFTPRALLPILAALLLLLG